MGDRGEITKETIGNLFMVIADGKTNGVFYLKGPAEENVFIIIKSGRVRHVSGDLGEGDPAIAACFTWDEGVYTFIEDITTDSGTFVDNISDEMADLLASGISDYDELAAGLTGVTVSTEIAPEKRAGSRSTLRRPAIIFFGELYPKLCFKEPRSLEDIRLLAIPDVFTGILSAITQDAIGYAFYIGGKRLGEARANEDGITACEGAAVSLFENAAQIEAYKYEPVVMDSYIALANGARAIARINSAAINIDEFIPWAEREKLTCFIWVSDKRHTANILISKGKTLGGLTNLSNSLNPVIDDALAIFYSPDALVEVFYV